MEDRTSKEKDVCEVFCIEKDKVEAKRRHSGHDSSSRTFKVLADETRVKVVYLLSKEELCV